MSKVVISTVLLICAYALQDAMSTQTQKVTKTHQYIPDYVDELKKYDVAAQRVKSLSPAFGELLKINDKKLHYGLFVITLSYLSRAKAPRCGNYNRDYLEIVRKAVPKAWNRPELVTKRLERTFNEIEFKLRDFRSLVEQCKNTTDIRACNEDVNKRFSLTNSARLVYYLGNLAAIYLYRTFQIEAEDFTMVRALITEKVALEPLATALALVMSEIHPRTHPCFDDDVFDE